VWCRSGFPPQQLPPRLQGRLQGGAPGQAPLLAPEDLAEQQRLREERAEAERARARAKAQEDARRTEVCSRGSTSACLAAHAPECSAPENWTDAAGRSGVSLPALLGCMEGARQDRGKHSA
jgi:hypothetical protein